MVEQETLNLFVASSILAGSTKVYFPIAQLVEQRTVNALVLGSSPSRGAISGVFGWKHLTVIGGRTSDSRPDMVR